MTVNEQQDCQLHSLRLPKWVSTIVTPGQVLLDEEERMAVAIALSARQVKEGTGGPFGALVCEVDSGVVLGVGVNQVTASYWSSAHAEFVAWSMAQQNVGGYDLGHRSGKSEGKSAQSAEDVEIVSVSVALYSSAQPCVSCWGGLFWTGISRLVYGATKSDVEQYAGFDEGPLPDDWEAALIDRGVSVQGGMLREEAIKSLREYALLGGERYNAGST